MKKNEITWSLMHPSHVDVEYMQRVIEIKLVWDKGQQDVLEHLEKSIDKIYYHLQP